MSDHSESDCCGSDVDETERLLLEDTLSPTEKEKSQPPVDIDETAPPAKSIEASLMPSPSWDTLATILDTVQKLAKRMDCLENRENVTETGCWGEGGGGRKADPQLEITNVPNHHVAPLWMLTPKTPPQTTRDHVGRLSKTGRQ